MLDVKPIRQTPSHCGPFCLKMVFDYYGKEINIEKIKDITKTVVSTGNFGTSPKNMEKTAKHFGFNAKYIQNSTLKQLKRFVVDKKIPVIVNWFHTNEGHYSVVIDVDKENIYLIDPEDASYKKISLITFQKIWFDFSGDGIKSNTDFRVHPMIIISQK